MNQKPYQIPSKKLIVKIPFNKPAHNTYSIYEDKLPYFCFSVFSKQRHLVHGTFTRYGGLSSAPYDTLNIGDNTGDNPVNVEQNMEIIRDVLGAKQLLFMNQVQKDNIIVLRKGSSVHFDTIPEADAIITDIPEIAIMIKQADCQGIILFDPVNTVVSVVHCGWRGNRCNIPGTVIQRMKSEFGCSGSDIVAAIGPSLGPCCGEFTTYKEIFPDNFKKFMVRENYFDLWELSKWQLLNEGLKKENIEIAEICTRCHNDTFFSYRAEPDTGRFATAAMIQE